jgi:hypothetical protein
MRIARNWKGPEGVGDGVVLRRKRRGSHMNGSQSESASSSGSSRSRRCSLSSIFHLGEKGEEIRNVEASVEEDNNER